MFIDLKLGLFFRVKVLTRLFTHSITHSWTGKSSNHLCVVIYYCREKEQSETLIHSNSLRCLLMYHLATCSVCCEVTIIN